MSPTIYRRCHFKQWMQSLCRAEVWFFFLVLSKIHVQVYACCGEGVRCLLPWDRCNGTGRNNIRNFAQNKSKAKRPPKVSRRELFKFNGNLTCTVFLHVPVMLRTACRSIWVLQSTDYTALWSAYLPHLPASLVEPAMRYMQCVCTENKKREEALQSTECFRDLRAVAEAGPTAAPSHSVKKIDVLYASRV